MFKDRVGRFLRRIGVLEAVRSESVQGATQDPECLSFGPDAIKPTDAILGLDFGTSSVKAVVRLPFLPSSPAFAVPLNGPGPAPYLLPTENIPAGIAAGSQGSRNMKVRLIVNPDDQEAAAHATALLATAMRQARSWFLDSQRANYGRFKLRWTVNLGIPSSGYEDDRIRSSLLKCARAAWAMSLRPEPPSELTAREALTSGLGLKSPVETVPEIAAAAEGYRKSVHARDGMHVMVDVGASTLDVCGFNLRSQGGDRPFTLFTTAVEQLGAGVLHDARLRSVSSQSSTSLAKGIDGRNPAQRVPDDLQAYVPSGVPVPQGLEKADSDFHAECQLAVRRVVAGMWQKNPKSSQWKSGTPTFLIGGGGRMDFYRTVPETIAEQKAANVTWGKLIPEELSVPPDLHAPGLDPGMLPRMMVAYGLSWPHADFGDIVNPASIPKMEAPPKRWLDDLYVGKELT